MLLLQPPNRPQILPPTLKTLESLKSVINSRATLHEASKARALSLSLSLSAYLSVGLHFPPRPAGPAG